MRHEAISNRDTEEIISAGFKDSSKGKASLINIRGINSMKRIKFWASCIKMVWDDRNSKSCRAKWRRLAKAFQKASDAMGL